VAADGQLDGAAARWLEQLLTETPAGYATRESVWALMRQLDFHGQELKLIDADLARIALGCENIKRLMTIAGVDVTVAMSITAAGGDFSRFSSPNKLVRYLGLNPRVKCPAASPQAMAGSPSKGAHARGMLVEAAWIAVKTPGPLRAFCERVRARRGMQIAVVATARKLTVLCWQMITCGEDYAHARPSLTAKSCARSSSSPAAPRDAARRTPRRALSEGGKTPRTRAR
jgi:transposase